MLADGVTASILQDLTVTDIGDEAVHLRSASSGNVLRGLTISDTGLREEKFGEGIYVGSAVSNWCQVSECEPDRSDGNIIVTGTISDTAAESIDIKEGTTGGIMEDNVFDGAGMRGDADSWVNIKGNGWVVRDNRGTSSRGSGFEVHRVVDGLGNRKRVRRQHCRCSRCRLRLRAAAGRGQSGGLQQQRRARGAGSDEHDLRLTPLYTHFVGRTGAAVHGSPTVDV